MRKAAGIVLITLGAVHLCGLILVLVVFGISVFLVPYYLYIPQVAFAVILLCSVVPAAFCITGGIFCLRRKYWRVCLALASLAVFFWVWDLGGSLLSSNIPMGLIPWVILVAKVIAVIFILRTKKEWQEISDSVDGKVSYGG